jgi:hypothetical protein
MKQASQVTQGSDALRKMALGAIWYQSPTILASHLLVHVFPFGGAACLLHFALFTAKRIGGNCNFESLARTRAIIAGSTSKRPQVLRILFYGQSITSPRWTDLAVEHLRKTYPNTLFDVRNMAIGGFGSVLLERTVERDIAEFYPDLIVFHFSAITKRMSVLCGTYVLKRPPKLYFSRPRNTASIAH